MHLLKHFKNLSLHPKNAEELKGLILQLAVQGKLTAKWRGENPDIEPASVLLERIKAEKAQLIKEKKIKKEKALPEISAEEIPFEIPSSWEWCRLGNLGYTQTGSTPSKSDVENYGNYIPFLSPADITNYSMSYPENGLSEKGLEKGRLIPKNSLMMVCIGGSIGKCNVNEIDVSCNQQINTITPILVSADFVKIICQSPYFQISVNGKASGSATPIINKGKWESLPIPSPPEKEQKEIVSIVNQLFAEVEQLEVLTKERIQLKEDFATSALAQLSTGDTDKEWSFLQTHFHTFFDQKSNIKKLRESILQLAVQGKLTHHWRAENPDTEHASELLKRIEAEKAQLIKEKKIKKEKALPEISAEEIPYKLPKGWVWCRLGDAMLKITDGTHHSPPNIDEGKFKYVTAKNIKRDGVNLSNITFVSEEVHQEIYSRCNPELGDILYIKDGATTGICCINNLDEEFSMLSSVALLKQPKEIIGNYLLSVLRSPFYYELMRAGMTGVAITRVTLKKMKESIIPLPPFEEQKAIVEKVNTLMGLCDCLEQEIGQGTQELEQLMQSSLKEVFV